MNLSVAWTRENRMTYRAWAPAALLEFADDVRLETLAVRQGLPATPWGENSRRCS